MSGQDETAEVRETEISGVKYSAHLLSVKGGLWFERNCKTLFLDNLESASGVDVNTLFGGIGKNKEPLAAVGIVQALTKFIRDTDYDAFYKFHIECCERCYVLGGETPVPVNIDTLKRPDNFKLFSWYCGVQLGPFMEWADPLITILKEAMTELSKREQNGSATLPQTSQTGSSTALAETESKAD